MIHSIEISTNDCVNTILLITASSRLILRIPQSLVTHRGWREGILHMARMKHQKKEKKDFHQSSAAKQNLFHSCDAESL